ncbi:alpha-glucosidase [mine drainage metagenome]|uniref:Alpha-glucosidase n=1 Tax=mine drainage metagenome TaxID=410659 RepID=A0A1J5SAY8_9ZZZZ
MNAEQNRLNENAAKEVPLELWGPYLSERQWGTVREDYSENGDAWNYFPHDHARSRVYRWGEDGLTGISDYNQNLCFSVALWNGKDPILKERLFGLTNGEGNHGEDVKELYYYIDNIPSHYYMQYLYKYPIAAFPYEDLINVNKNRNKQEPEYEILDTGVFNDQKYFDVYVTYAKQSSEDIFIKIEIINRSSEDAAITVLPTLWFYNKWQFNGLKQKPSLAYIDPGSVKATHEQLGNYYFYFQEPSHVFFTENETNFEKLFNRANTTAFVKDAFHDAIVHKKNTDALHTKKEGTKCSPVYERTIKAKSSSTLFLRLSNVIIEDPFKEGFDAIFDTRKKEADDFYNDILPKNITTDQASVRRQAFAGLLWSKQYYHFDVERWLSSGDGITAANASKLNGRNSDWKTLKNQDIILMPDKWEYPWYAAWDLAFHCIAIAAIDPGFAKNQLIILTREWYMNPDGQIPAYEWNFSDVNPPVQAFAAMEVYRIEKEKNGTGDINFLKKIFQKLIINFTWWANRKDANGNNIFEGGFLGLDNIGVFNRSSLIQGEINLEQTDGTSWMGMYALNMMDIACEIAMFDNAFENTVTKFYEHFVLIAGALNEFGLWNAEDNFYYDILSLSDNNTIPLKLKSIVGLSPLFAVAIIRNDQLNKLPDFKKRMEWFIQYRKQNNKYVAHQESFDEQQLLLSLADENKLTELLSKILNDQEFLAPGGVRALSKYYQNNPYNIRIGNENYSVSYDPGDSTSGLFGGNSNWRGPVWMPVNYLLIKAIMKYADFYKDELKIEFPLHSQKYISLKEVAAILIERNWSIFLRDENKERPVYGNYNWFYQLPENQNLVLFYEYYHGDSSRGLGASHQTGWTALITAI